MPLPALKRNKQILILALALLILAGIVGGSYFASELQGRFDAHPPIEMQTGHDEHEHAELGEF